MSISVKSSVRLPFVIGLFAIGMTTSLSEAWAQTVFMVQLGSYKTQEEAKGQWDKLSSTFPDLFQPLSYAPTEVMLPPDDFVYHRTQAGPVATREDADKICERVVSSGFECYVVETAMFTAPYNEAETKEASAAPAAPVAEAKSTFFDSSAEDAQPAKAAAMPAPQKALETALASPAAPAPDAPTPVALPSLSAASAPSPSPQPTSQALAASAPAASSFGSSNRVAGSPFISGPSVPEGGSAASPSLATSANIAGTGRADVSVAEAIPVPLSNLNQKGNLPYASGFRGTPSSYNPTMAMWAEIGYFESQGTALGYWNVLRQRDSSIPGGLRLRVTQPFTQKHLAQKLSLRVGPFSNVAAIRRLCSFTRPEKLGCRAVRDLGGSITQSAATANSRMTGSAGYNTRRGPTLAGGTQSASPFAAANTSSGASESGMYWIQLGAFMAPQAAQEKWAQLQGQHKAQLGSLNPQIYTPTGGARNLFRLRAGPFARAGDAVSTCEGLKRAGTLCVVVSER